MPSLYHSKLADAAKSVNSPEGHNTGDGEEVTIKKHPQGGYHTISKHHDGHVTEEDHQTIEEAVNHVHGHFGHQKPMREKNPKMREKESEGEHHEEAAPAPASLADMGVESE